MRFDFIEGKAFRRRGRRSSETNAAQKTDGGCQQRWFCRDVWGLIECCLQNLRKFGLFLCTVLRSQRPILLDCFANHSYERFQFVFGSILRFKPNAHTAKQGCQCCDRSHADTVGKPRTLKAVVKDVLLRLRIQHRPTFSFRAAHYSAIWRRPNRSPCWRSVPACLTACISGQSKRREPG